MSSIISVMIADTQYLVRAGLRYILTNYADIKIVGEAIDKDDLFSLLQTLKPNVLIFDYNKAGVLDIDDLAMVHHLSQNTSIIVISADQERANILKILSMGVNVFLTKECDETEIIDAIRAASNKGRLYCKKIIDILGQSEISEDCSSTPLSSREIEIVTLICAGKTSREIATELYLSPHTIFTHRKNIFKKLSINSSSELIRYAIKMGIIEPDMV